MIASYQGSKMLFRNLFAILILILLFLMLAGCHGTRIYRTSEVICTWNNVEELVICKDHPLPKGESIE